MKIIIENGKVEICNPVDADGQTESPQVQKARIVAAGLKEFALQYGLDKIKFDAE